MIIVSTEILAALYLEGDLTAVAEAVLERDPAWATPMIWRALLPLQLSEELAAGRLDSEEARQIARSAAMLFKGREFPSPLENNLEHVIAGCPPLMAPFVSLARGLGCPLITTSVEVLRAFPEASIAAAEFACGERAVAE